MIPLPQITELDELPAEFTAEELWPGLGARNPAAAGTLDRAALQRFRALMAQERWPVQLARMCYDRLYAYERIAQAHASANEELRGTALQLFQAFHCLDQNDRSRLDD